MEHIIQKYVRRECKFSCELQSFGDIGSLCCREQKQALEQATTGLQSAPEQATTGLQPKVHCGPMGHGRSWLLPLSSAPNTIHPSGNISFDFMCLGDNL